MSTQCLKLMVEALKVVFKLKIKNITTPAILEDTSSPSNLHGLKEINLSVSNNFL